MVEFISGFENSDIKVVVRKAGSGAELEVHLVRASSTKLLATHLLWDSLRQLQEEDVKDPEDVTSGIERCRELLERLNAVITQRDTEYRARLVEARRNIGVGLADARDVLRMAMAMTESSSWGGGRLANAGESETSRLAEQCQQLKSRLIQEDEARQGLEAEIDSLKILGMNPSPPHKKVQEQSKTIEALQGQVQQLQLRLMQAETERGQLMKVASEEMTNPEIDESVSKSKLLGRMEKQADLINALKGELQKASSQGMRQSQEIESLRRSSTSFGSNDPQEQQQQSRSVLAIEVERLNRLLQGVKEKSEVCRMKLEGELIEAKSKHMLMETELEQAVQKYVTLLGEKDDLVLDLKTAGIRLEQLNLKFEEQQRLAQDHSRLLRQRIAALEATTSAAHVPLPPIPDLNPSVSDDPMGIKELVASIDSVLTPRNQSLQGNVSLRGSQLAALSSFDVVHPHDSGGKNANESVASSGNVVDEDRDVKPPGQDLEERLGCDGRTLVIGKDDVRNADPTVLGGIQALAEHAVKMEARNDVKKGGGEQVVSLLITSAQVRDRIFTNARLNMGSSTVN